MKLDWITPHRLPTRVERLQAIMVRAVDAARPAEGEDEYSPEEIAQAYSNCLRLHCQHFAIPHGVTSIPLKGTIG